MNENYKLWVVIAGKWVLTAYEYPTQDQAELIAGQYYGGQRVAIESPSCGFREVK